MKEKKNNLNHKNHITILSVQFARFREKFTDISQPQRIRFDRIESSQK